MLYSISRSNFTCKSFSNYINAVLKCFVPSADTTTLRLPQERCARYMRREEYTISERESLNLNSDGTTKFLKKIGEMIWYSV